MASFSDAIEESGLSKLPLTFAHAAALTELPLHHRDPFDRMLTVQAMYERLTLVTADRRFGLYDTPILWT